MAGRADSHKKTPQQGEGIERVYENVTLSRRVKEDFPRGVIFEQREGGGCFRQR